MHQCLHSCPAAGLSFRYTFRSTRSVWQTTKPSLRRDRRASRPTPTQAVLTKQPSALSIPGVGDLSKLKVDLSDVPDGRYREVEVSILPWSSTAAKAAYASAFGAGVSIHCVIAGNIICQQKAYGSA